MTGGREWIPALVIQGGVMHRLVAFVAVVVVSMATVAARSDDLGTPVDLSGLSEIAGASSSSAPADLPLGEVVSGRATSANRFYLAGILGSSFATVDAGGTNTIASIFGNTISVGQVGSANPSLFTGGGALGMAFDRGNGQWRTEVEGRWRDPLEGTATGFLAVNGTPLVGTDLDFRLSGGWSAMTNFWRDLDLTDRFGIYGGGGFGAGGYQYQTTGKPIPGLTIGGQSTVTTFAWQVGTGLTYQISDKITFDTGYRFFALGAADVPVAASAAVGPIAVALPLGNFSSAFTASELLFSLRIYEPFRNWR
jgi:opacity protein-like surface antigen